MKKFTIALLLIATTVLIFSCTEEVVRPKVEPGVVASSNGQF